MNNADRATLAESAQETLLQWRARIADFRGRGIYAGYPDRFRCIFIHVPKTAGSSVARALFDENSRHIPYLEFERANAWKFRSYFKFAFVRNPWDRLVSTYFFLKRGGINELDRDWSAQHLAAYASFSEFVRDWLCEDNVSSFPHFRPQSYFLADPQGKVMVDFVGRYENLLHDFTEVARRLGRECQLPLYNKGDHAHFTSYYDDETRDIVGRIYSRDVELFGYRYDD